MFHVELFLSMLHALRFSFFTSITLSVNLKRMTVDGIFIRWFSKNKIGFFFHFSNSRMCNKSCYTKWMDMKFCVCIICVSICNNKIILRGRKLIWNVRVFLVTSLLFAINVFNEITIIIIIQIVIWFHAVSFNADWMSIFLWNYILRQVSVCFFFHWHSILSLLVYFYTQFAFDGRKCHLIQLPG